MAKQKKEDREKIARTLYFAGENQKEIAERVGVSEKTISKWVKDKRWKELRAARNITRPELTNKILLSIDKLLDNAINADEPDDNFADKLAKFASAIEKIDRKISVVDLMDAFMAHSTWLQRRMASDKEIDRPFLRKAIKYHDLHVGEVMGNNAMDG